MAWSTSFCAPPPVLSNCLTRASVLVCSSSTPADGEQSGFGLKQIGAVDGEQRIAFLHFVADVEERIDDSSGIWRERLHQHVLIEVDRADRILQRLEGTLFRGNDLEALGLLVGQDDILLVDVDIGRGVGRRAP